MSTVPDAGRKPAAFFDVDGTLVQTTIVHYYVYFRRRRMSPLVGTLWYAIYLIKCTYYMLLDRIDRSKLNIVFYRSYAGLSAAEIKAQADDCYRDVIKPRQFAEGAACVAEHRKAGHEVVLVTGSIDFIMGPLAKDLGISRVVAPSLVESKGRFTGELDGPPIGEVEKARRIRQFADEHGIDLSRSHAYGDSIADLPMLELVGYPHVVNPDRRLETVARSRGWAMHSWTLGKTPSTGRERCAPLAGRSAQEHGG
jgi:HAD superfamily hydrolase (TIGR01490 family)